ncbi:HNH endonuclease, partial [Salmonella enterica]|nr:HNH endonuclease [Salmonella enterica]
MPIEISNHSEYLLEKRAEKYSPITYLGTVHQGYCSVISKVIAWYLLSRAGVYYKNNSIVELEKSIGYRDTKSVSHRVSNLNALMSSLSRENILDTLDKFGELIYSDYKYQNSTTYDLEYDGVRYPPK